MELTIIESLVYTGVTKVTFLKKKIPHRRLGKKKIYSVENIEKGFEGKDIPRILPAKPSSAIITSESDGDTVIPPFKPDKHAQVVFDEIVEGMGDKYTTAHNSIIESLLILQHAIRFYHQKVIEDPRSDWSKLLSQSLKDEVAILRALGLVMK